MRDAWYRRNMELPQEPEMAPDEPTAQVSWYAIALWLLVGVGIWALLIWAAWEAFK